MLPQSLGLAWIRLGSARAIFQKARIEKIGKKEPVWGLFKIIICKSLILTKKDKFFFYNSPKGPFSVKKLVKIGQKKPNLGYTRYSALKAIQYLFSI